MKQAPGKRGSHLDRFPPENEERFGSLRQKTSELMDEDVLNLVRLLDLDAYPNAVDTRLNEDLLVLVSCDGQRG